MPRSVLTRGDSGNRLFSMIALSSLRTIEFGDDKRLSDFLSRVPHTDQPVVFMLESEGGNVVAALRMAHIIRDLQVSTLVPDECASACFWLFAAGRHRIVGQDAKIGVHSESIANGETDMTLADTTRDIRRAAAEWSIPERIVGKLVMTPPEQMAWLDRADLKAMNVTIAERVR
jgi:hypothetical protein